MRIEIDFREGDEGKIKEIVISGLELNHPVSRVVTNEKIIEIKGQRKKDYSEIEEKKVVHFLIPKID